MAKVLDSSLVNKKIDIRDNLWEWILRINKELNTQPLKEDDSIDILINNLISRNILDQIKDIYIREGWDIQELVIDSDVLILNFKSNQNPAITKADPSKKFIPQRMLTNDDLINGSGQQGLYVGEIAYALDWNTLIFWNGTDWRRLQDLKFNPKPSGTGSAGIFAESFESISLVLNNWYPAPNTPSISTTANSTSTGYWNIRSGSTPSSGTGPTSPQSGSYFIYAEVSSGANALDYKLRTSNFAELINVSFYINMTGSNIGIFNFNIFSGGVWSTFYSNVQDTGTGWKFVNLDLTGLNIEEIEFEYSGATGYQGDFCLDNVEIQSI